MLKGVWEGMGEKVGEDGGGGGGGQLLGTITSQM